MRDFVITTDSTVDLPKEWLEEHRVPTLRLAYTIDGETYPDMEGLSKERFFRPDPKRISADDFPGYSWTGKRTI